MGSHQSTLEVLTSLDNLSVCHSSRSTRTWIPTWRTALTRTTSTAPTSTTTTTTSPATTTTTLISRTRTTTTITTTGQGPRGRVNTVRDHNSARRTRSEN